MITKLYNLQFWKSARGIPTKNVNEGEKSMGEPSALSSESKHSSAQEGSVKFSTEDSNLQHYKEMVSEMTQNLT